MQTSLEVLHKMLYLNRDNVWTKTLDNHNQIYTGFKQHKTNTQIRGYFVIDHRLKTIILGFLGTKTKRDLYYDLKFKRIVSPFTSIKGKIHHGFYRLFKECLPELYPLFHKLTTQYPDYKLIFTGHSLGAVLAVFFGIWILNKYPNIKYVLTLFCLPKFSNKLFNKNYLELLHKCQIKIYTTKNIYDLVTRLPPSLFGYQSLYKFQNREESNFKKFRIKCHSITRIVEDFFD